MTRAFAVWLVASAGCAPGAGGPTHDRHPPSPTDSASPTPGEETDDPVDTDDTDDPGPTVPYEMDNFSFVDEHVAGMPQPGRRVPLAQDLDFLVDQQIRLLVSLTEQPTNPVAVEAAGLDLLHLPIADFTPPTFEQQLAFVDATLARVAQGERVGVHDTAGYGRCGTMLATWFVAKGMDAEAAMAEIRALRPGSIETDAQEQAVRDFAAAYSAP